MHAVYAPVLCLCARPRGQAGPWEQLLCAPPPAPRSPKHGMERFASPAAPAKHPPSPKAWPMHPRTHPGLTRGTVAAGRHRPLTGARGHASCGRR